MHLTTYLFKKLTGKLANKKVVTPFNTPRGGLLMASGVFDGKWGELSEDVTIDRPIIRAQDDDKEGGGWNLIINNYTKCDVPSHISWDMQFYKDTDNGDIYVRSQTKEEIYFLFWVVATMYSFDTWIKLPSDYFNGTEEQQRYAIKHVFDFTDHGAMNSYGVPVNSRIYIDKKNPKHYIQLGTMCHISGGGRNDSDYIIVNF